VEETAKNHCFSAAARIPLNLPGHLLNITLVSNGVLSEIHLLLSLSKPLPLLLSFCSVPGGQGLSCSGFCKCRLPLCYACSRVGCTYSQNMKWRAQLSGTRFFCQQGSLFAAEYMRRHASITHVASNHLEGHPPRQQSQRCDRLSP